MQLLDTDALTHVLAGHQGIVRRLARLEDPDVATTDASALEQIRRKYGVTVKPARRRGGR